MVAPVIISIVVVMFLSVCIIVFVFIYQRKVINHQVELKKINEQKERELIQASIQSEEEERLRIAAELHDDVGATLASARLFLYKSKDARYDEQAISQSKELLDESISKIRSISHKLQPAILQQLRLELSLQSLLETLNKSGKLTAGHILQQPLPRMPDNVELAAYRISQELLANIVKHTGATAVVAETGAGDGFAYIKITNDVNGLTQEMFEELVYKKGATGLKNVVNRLKSIDASLQFIKEDDGRFSAKLLIPTLSQKQ